MRKFIIAFITAVIALGATEAFSDTDYLAYKTQLDQKYLQMISLCQQKYKPGHYHDYNVNICTQQLEEQRQQELQQYMQEHAQEQYNAQRQQNESMALQRQGVVLQKQQAEAATKTQAQEERNIILAGTEAYNKQDYATTAYLWKPLAEQGNADAQLGLGLLYKAGHGVPQDYKQAQYWLCQSAKQGNTEAAESISKTASGTANPNADVVASVYCGR